MKVEVDIDKIINNLSKRRMELMMHLCEQIYEVNFTLKIVNELRYLTGMINEMEKLK